LVAGGFLRFGTLAFQVHRWYKMLSRCASDRFAMRATQVIRLGVQQ
jgi:hypothetical protein